MSLAKFRKTDSKNGSGRFVVSEGIAPAEALLPHVGLPTQYLDIEDDRFEVVITKGTILSLIPDSNGDSRVVPANGTGTDKTWEDADTFNFETGATPTDVDPDTDTCTVPGRSVPIGCAQYDLYRPFDKGTSQLSGIIARAYVEWPLVLGLNDNLAVGDMVRSDVMGRPVRFVQATGQADADSGEGDASESSNFPWLAVGKVWAIEKFATNFDDGLLSYMQLPSDPGALKTVYEITKAGTYKNKLGIRANLDVANCLGAFRVNLTL